MRTVVSLVIVLGALLVLTGCGGGEAAEAQDAAPVATSNAPARAATQVLLPTPTHDAAFIMATWRNTKGLSRLHLIATEEPMVCANCHQVKDAASNIVFEEPSDSVCLGCHEGSVVKILALKDEQGKQIHEPVHPGVIPCIFCHTGHIETTNPCSYCH